jgi:nucleotide-binding universal stress UspA family protein
MTLRRIAVAVDFSPESIYAFDHAVGLARRDGAAVTMVHVAVTIDPLEIGLPDAATLPAFRQLIVEDASATERALTELRARAVGVAVDSVVVDGFPDAALVAAAAERDADLVVLGTHGRTGLGRALLGSVAEKVIRTAGRDVMVARGAPPAGGYASVLVPTDFSPLSERALDAALALVADGGEVILFHAWHLPGGHPRSKTVDDAFEPVRQAVADGARRRGAEVIASRAGGRATLRVEVAEGNPARAIDQRAAGCDLIVMGGHGRRGLRRWLLGSTAEATVRGAPCSVVVVHPAEIKPG